MSFRNGKKSFKEWKHLDEKEKAQEVEAQGSACIRERPASLAYLEAGGSHEIPSST